MKQQSVVIYESGDGQVGLDVELKDDTVWLTQKQLCELFDRDKSVISRHINNIFKSGELSKAATVAKNATVQTEGKRDVIREVEYYNLDMIISLGYRVNSQRATQFRIWATNVLKDHLIKGYSVNQARLRQKGLDEFNRTIELLRSTIEKTEIGLDEAKVMLDIILNYSRTWSLLQGYDEKKCFLIMMRVPYQQRAISPDLSI